MIPVFTPHDAVTAQKKQETLPIWNLKDLYDAMDSDQLSRDFEAVHKRAEELSKKYQGKLAEIASRSGGDLLDAIKEYESLCDLIGKIGSFAGLSYAGNMTDEKIAKFYGDTQDRLTKSRAHLLFFELEMNRIADDIMEVALRDEGLAYYRPWIEDLRKERPHQLDDALEELLMEKHMTGASSWNRLFNETIADLRFEIDGEELTIEPTLKLLLEAESKKRKSASEALAKTFSENLRIFTLITNVLAKDKEISDRWRKFNDVADGRHLANRVEKPVVDALENAVVEAYPQLSHRYYALKAKWMGVDQLDHWDRNAPLPEEDDRDIPWAEAKDIVLAAYNGFAPEMASIARRFFDENWIDAQIRDGKSPGAFAHPTVPSAHPYVLVNYLGTTRDVMTLAHELGHGVHQVLAGKQGALMAGTPLTLAETASVFGEMLTFKSLLSQASTPTQRKVMLAGKVEDMLNTVVRQIAFYRFERKVHEARRNGELTTDQINELWMSVQGESLGPAIRLGAGYETFWAYIPHFIHSPFYVYAYAFGDCLVNSLYGVYQSAEDGFVEKYFNMLGAGGSKHHSELLAPFGLDASDPAFWTIGLDMISSMIDELEQI